MSEFMPIPERRGYLASRDGCIVGRRGRILKPFIDPDGYARVGITTDDGKFVTRGVHQLVCLTYNGPRPDGKMCCHRDGLRQNNVPGNLYWGTAQQNTNDCISHGMRRGARCGSSHHLAKIREEDIPKILTMRKAGMTQKEVSSAFGISRTQISHIENGKRWKHRAGE